MNEDKRLAGIEEIEALTKRFKDYIDKIQTVFDKSKTQQQGNHSPMHDNDKATKKLYTVVSPVEAMATNLKSVLSAIDKAMMNMDELTIKDSDGVHDKMDVETADNREGLSGVITAEPAFEKFTAEELDFLVRTFNSILNTPEEERKKIFSQFEKKDSL